MNLHHLQALANTQKKQEATKDFETRIKDLEVSIVASTSGRTIGTLGITLARIMRPEKFHQSSIKKSPIIKPYNLWNLAIGFMGEPKKIFEGKSVEDVLTQAEKFFANNPKYFG